jgi:16S rRNA (cytosine1402-N4)-methyltransferase
MSKRSSKYGLKAKATGHSLGPSSDQLANQSTGSYHLPVLLQEAVDGLNIQPDGIYVDCTFGGGGHSKAILSRLDERGKLFAFDQDADAAKNLPEDPRIVFVPHNFRHLQRFLRLHKVPKVNGILADLGVSSHQFDEADRGFSTRFEADLDMRMDKRQSLTAFEVVNSYTEQRLHKLFEQYGEVTNAKTLAKTIMGIRHNASLKTVKNFKLALNAIVKGNPNKYFAQVFQALRIEVNDELGALKEMLQQTPEVLLPNGRISIITFHSLEDRIVKNFFKKGTFEEEQTNPFSLDVQVPLMQALTKKPITPNEEELRQNPRSRSAKLRVAARL